MHDTAALVSEVERQAGRFLSRNSPHFTSLVDSCVDALRGTGHIPSKPEIRKTVRAKLDEGQVNATALQRKVGGASWIEEDLQQEAWLSALQSGHAQPAYTWRNRRPLDRFNKLFGKSCNNKAQPHPSVVDWDAENLMHLRDCFNRLSEEHQDILQSVFFEDNIVVEYAKDHSLTLLDAMDLFDAALTELQNEWHELDY